jgi:hypothetical protein
MRMSASFEIPPGLRSRKVALLAGHGAPAARPSSFSTCVRPMAQLSLHESYLKIAGCLGLTLLRHWSGLAEVLLMPVFGPVRGRFKVVWLACSPPRPAPRSGTGWSRAPIPRHATC